MLTEKDRESHTSVLDSGKLSFKGTVQTSGAVEQRPWSLGQRHGLGVAQVRRLGLLRGGELLAARLHPQALHGKAGAWLGIANDVVGGLLSAGSRC